jgi:hypothetical protein
MEELRNPILKVFEFRTTTEESIKSFYFKGIRLPLIDFSNKRQYLSY